METLCDWHIPVVLIPGHTYPATKNLTIGPPGYPVRQRENRELRPVRMRECPHSVISNWTWLIIEITESAVATVV